MPEGASAQPELLVDTSVAVALVVADHRHHRRTAQSVGERSLGLCGHAAFETFSVLTRLPPPARRSPTTVARLLSRGFPRSRFLSPGAAHGLLGQLAARGISGGSVYDALVGAAAVEHDLALATRDRRALDVYHALGVDVQLVA